MGFAACTNEVEEFASQTQDYPGVELPKGFAIDVVNADFAADAETRAAFEQVGTKWIPAWGKDANGNNDAIGAAWFNKFKYDANGKVTDPRDVFEALDEYGSNTKFVWQGGQTFQSEAICKLGAYVLYYPFNKELTDDMSVIPVTEIDGSQSFDVENPTEEVTKNITAANVVVFKESDDLAPEFTIQQIPNLYALSFYMHDEALMSLADDIKITHVMVEAKTTAGGAIYTDGYIYPSTTELSAKYYEGTETNKNYIPEIKFQGTTLTDRMLVTVENSNEDYWITEAGAENGTKQFFFSMLPITHMDPADTKAALSFKVIAKVGNKTKVFYKDVDLNKAYVARMAKTGETIALNVGLENVAEFDGIYSVEQFIEEWNNGATSFNFQIPMPELAELSSDVVDFALADDKAVTFKGMPVTLPSISGNYTFDNEVTINGDANLVGGGANKINVTGNLTVDGTSKSVTLKGVSTVGGNLTTSGKVTINGKNTVITKNVYVKNGKLKLPNNTEIKGSVTIYTDTKTGTTSTLEAPGAKIKSTLTVNYDTEAIMSGAWSAKTVNVYGTLSQTKSATATVDKLNVTQKAGKNKPVLNMTEGTVIFKELTVNEAIEGGVQIDAAIGNAEIAGNVIAKSPVKFNGEVTNMGNITAAADVTFGATVTKVGDIAGANATPATGKITFNGAVTKAGTINAANTVTFMETAATNDITTSAAVVFTKEATTGAITTTANVTFAAPATVQGNITATGNIAIKGTDVKVMKEIEGDDPIYSNVVLKDEAKLEATNLVAKNVTVNDQYSMLTVTNKLDVKGTLTANGKVIAPVKAASTINTLTIKPGITVDMSEATEVATINNLTTETKGEYDGILLTSATFATNIGSGTNSGKIEGAKGINVTTGEFNMFGEITNAITVNTGAKLNVAYDYTNSITNNGQVVVKEGKKLTTKALTNKGTLIVEKAAEILATNSVDNAVIDVKEGAKLTISANQAKGKIYVEDGSIVAKKASTYTFNKVAYIWEADKKPTDVNITSIITEIDMKNATVEKATDITNIANINTINVEGTWTLPAGNLDLTVIANGINVKGDATFTSEGLCKPKAIVDVAAEKVLTIDDAHVQFQTGSSIKLNLNASLKGDKKGATLN